MGTEHSEAVGDELHIARTQVSTGDPNGVVTAGIIGELYYDSTGDDLYVSEAADDSSWVSISAAVTGPTTTTSGALAYWDDTTGTTLEHITGVTSDGVDIAFADDILLTFGDTAEFSISHSGSVTTFITTGGLQFHSTLTNGTIDFDLGSDDQNTGVRFRNLSDAVFLRIDSDGTDTVLTASPGDLILDAASGVVIDNFTITGASINATTDIQMRANNLGFFLFTESGNLRAGDSLSTYLEMGHDGSEGTIDLVGTGDMNFKHEGATVMTLTDASVLDFAAATTISTTAGDLTLAPAGDVIFSPGGGGYFVFDDHAIHVGTSVTEQLELGHTTTEAVINAIGTGVLEFQHEGSTVMTLSDAGKLSIPLDLSTPQFTIGANDDFQFFHTGTKSHMQNFVGDLDILVVTGDLVVETSTLGHFLFTQNEFRAGVSTSEYLKIGHDDSNSFIDAVGDGLMNFNHEGTTVMSLSDATVLNFPLGDLTVTNGSGGDFLFADDEFRAGETTSNYVRIGHDGSNSFIDGVGSGLFNLQRDGSTFIAFDSGGSITLAGDVFGDGFSGGDFDGNRFDATIELAAPEITASQTFSFHEGSTQHVAAVPDLRSGRVSTSIFKQSTDISGQDANPQHIYLRVDGEKMYFVGEENNSVYEYDLSTPWDISSASHLRTFSVATQDTSPRGIFFKPDGLVMYISGGQNDSVYQYDLGTAWNISTAVFDDSISVVTDTQNPNSVTFVPDGSGFFVVSFTEGQVSKYGMSTPWNVATASFENGFLPTEPGDFIGVGFRSDGALMYLSSGGDDAIYEYFLGTPWNTTANTTFLTKLTVSGDGATAMRGVFFSPFHHKMYFPDAATDAVLEYDLGLKVDGKIISGPADVIDIYDLDDLEVNAVSDIWTISADTTLNWIGDVTGSVRFSIDSGITLHIDGGNRATAKYTYNDVGAADCFSGEGAVRMFGLKNWDSTEAGKLFNLTGGGTVNIRDVLNLTGWDPGNTNGQVFGINSVWVTVNSTFVITNPSLVNITDWAIEGDLFGGKLFTIVTDNPASIMNFTDISGLSLSSSGALFDFSGKSNNNARFSVRNCKVGKDTAGVAVGHIFEPQTTGDHGFTAVADASPSTGTITASASNGSDGTTVSCTTTYFEDEEVTISGATASDGIYQIFNVVAGVSFDIIRTFTVSDTAGSVDSNRLTLTLVTAHNTLVGDLIDVENSNFYNGFYIMLNFPSTDVAEINGVFVATDTGDYKDGGGLDQRDPRVLAIGNSPFRDSHFIATAYVNNNSTANGTIVNNTFTDMVFGTAGSALIAGSTMERWKLVDELNGTFEYIGNEPFDGDITFDFTVTSAGGTVEFRFKWLMDSGSGFAVLPDDVEALIDVASNTRSVSKTFPLAADKGDQIKPQITRNSGNSTITTSYATIFASQ